MNAFMFLAYAYKLCLYFENKKILKINAVNFVYLCKILPTLCRTKLYCTVKWTQKQRPIDW